MTRLARGLYLAGKPALAFPTASSGAVWDSSNPDYMATGAQPTYPFPGSPWTTAIPDSPTLASNSATLVSNLVAQVTAQYGTVSVGSNAGRSVVHGNQLTATTVEANPGNRWSGAPEGSLSVPLAPTSSPGPSTDYPLAIWDVDAQLAYDFWVFNPVDTCNTLQVHPTDGSWTAGFGSWTDDPSGLSSTTTASGAPYIAGLITLADCAYGSIDHALMLVVGNAATTYVAPATANDGSETIADGGIPYGSLFFFESSVSSSGLSGFQLMVFNALQQYGMYAVDQTGGYGLSISFESVNPWFNYDPDTVWPYDTSTAYETLADIPWSSLSVLTARTT